MAMQPISPRGGHRRKLLLRRFDRTVGRINPFLLAIAIGLGVLYITSLAALMVRLPEIHLHACVETQPIADYNNVQLK
jgi:hypothetical protein